MVMGGERGRHHTSSEKDQCMYVYIYGWKCANAVYIPVVSVCIPVVSICIPVVAACMPVVISIELVYMSLLFVST
jgi:hypothetical protein